MNKILPTIGPINDNQIDIKKILKFSNTIRINGSHNTLSWHKRVANIIKDINDKTTILMDVPGIKPRTANVKDIVINKNQIITFVYGKKFNKNIDNIIRITNPLPQINKKSKSFSINDGQHEFTLISYEKNYVKGKSKTAFILKPKKGLNIPYSIYDEIGQLKIYLNFIEKYKTVRSDALGLSFIQSKSILRKINKKFPNKIIVAKVENYLGLKNVEEICKYSDIIMIDRGDLAAEIGDNHLYSAVVKISSTAKKYGRPLIMATENLESMITRKTPTKSEVVSLGFSLSLNADKIMLSDETATSSNWLNSIKWLDQFLKINDDKKNIKSRNSSHFWDIVKNIPKNIPIVIFSKKGLAIEKISHIKSNSQVIVFTDNKKTASICAFRSDTTVLIANNFDRSKKSSYIYDNIKANKNLIFKNNTSAVVIYIFNPRKKSRANTISLVEKKDFIKNI